MQKMLFSWMLATLFLGFLACNKDSQGPDDETLAMEITADRNRKEISPMRLPEPARRSLNEDFFDTYPEVTYHSPGRGYECIMASGERVFFNEAGRILRVDMRRGGPGNPPNGPCGQIAGEWVHPDSLSQTIKDYVATNYPDAQILRAKKRGDKYIVLLSGHLVLVFNADGSFGGAAQIWHDCRPCIDPGVAQLPAAVIDYVAANYPNAEIKRVCRRGDRIVIGLLSASGRVLLVYDKDWNLLFSIP
ncbi:MAG: PepSY-like domain-containing protein [Saprospiraceae bacterium]